MPSIPTLLKGLVALAPLVSAAPADYVRRATSTMSMATPAAVITEKAEPASATSSSSSAKAAAAAATPAAAAGKLTDVDILNL